MLKEFQKKYFTYKYFSIITLLFVPLVLGFLSLKLGQDTNWDLLNYHYYNPYALLNGRINYDLAPAGVQTFYNSTLDLFYYLAISIIDVRLVGFGLGFLHGINFIILFFIGRILFKEFSFGDKIYYFLAFAGILTVAFLSELGTLMHDNLTSIFPLLALLIVISNIKNVLEGRTKTISRILFAGFVAGLGGGLKLVVVIYAFAIFLSFLLLSLDWKNKLKFAFLFGLGCGFGWLITGGYWAFLMWFYFENPVFPHFNNFFRAELAPFESMKDERFLPQSIYEKLFYPIIFTFEPNRVSELKFIQYTWFSLYFVLIIFLSSRILNFLSNKISFGKLSSESRFFISFFCIAYFLWLNMFGIYRYLTTLEVLTPILFFLITTLLFKSKLMVTLSLIFILGLTIVNLRGIPDWGRSGWANPVVTLETNELNNTESRAIFLGGQPLAWVIPALNPKAPVIQAFPNFPFTLEYWAKARNLIEEKPGKLFIILESTQSQNIYDINKGLKKIDLIININSCKPFVAYFGNKPFNYQYCEVVSK